MDVQRDEDSGERHRPSRRRADLLKPAVEGGAQAVTRLRGPVAEHSPRTAERVDLDALPARDPAQVAIVGVLDSRLSDDVPRPHPAVAGHLELPRTDLS